MKAVDLFDLGYTDLVSVVPPDGVLSPASHIRPEARGKAPAVRYSSGLWGGYDWISTTTSRADAERMDRDGANVGLKAARFPAVDIDVRDESLANLIAGHIARKWPSAPIRIGQWPKRLFMFRLAEDEAPFGKYQLYLTVAGDRHLVEILASGQQYLIAGRHAKTGCPYEWNVPIPRANALPPVCKADLAALLVELEEMLTMIGVECERVGKGSVVRHEIDQETLQASSLDVLEEAVRAIPNTMSSHPTWDDYIRLGYAIKAASQADPDRGFQIFLEWALRWEGNGKSVNTVESVTADWNRMHPPFEIGAQFVYDMARQYGWDHARYEFPADPAPAPPAPEDQEPEVKYSDMWIAERVIREYGGRIRYVTEWGKWLAWDGSLWRNDLTAAVPGFVRRVCTTLANEIQLHGATTKEKKECLAIAKRLSSSAQLTAVLQLMKVDSRVIAPASLFDSDPDILGTPGGIVDLRTGKLYEADPSRYVSKVTTATPREGPAPKWTKFLDEATGGDEELKRYLQRLAGYCLTGSVQEQVFFFFHGEGENGKGTFIDSLYWALGSYAVAAQMDTFLASENTRHPTELAVMAGARLVTAQETREGRSWDEQRIKALTGGDPISARYMHQDFFTFAPTFKLIFSGNHRPHIRTVDKAMRRRIHLIPFVHTPPRINKNLKQELRDEYPQILAWAVEGAKIWYREGLKPPPIVLDATEQYLGDQDALGRWLNDCCVVSSVVEVRASEAYAAWVSWCEEAGESPGSQRAFTQKLIDRNIARRRRSSKGIVLEGFALQGQIQGSIQ